MEYSERIFHLILILRILAKSGTPKKKIAGPAPAPPTPTCPSHLYHTLYIYHIYILPPGNYKAHLMTAPQIPQRSNKILGAYLAFPPIYMWPFGMQTLLVQCATCHKHLLTASRPHPPICR
jgi:hypothetical protein